MSRSDHSKGCPNGRGCGVCHPGKMAAEVPARDRRKLQGDQLTEFVRRGQAAQAAVDEIIKKVKP